MGSQSLGRIDSGRRPFSRTFSYFRSSEEEEDTMADEEAKKKQEEIDRKKAEVRQRLEEQNQKKQKKGFMTPERKKKLRLLLRKKAAEELKKEQERKAAERQRIIAERCGQAKNLDGANEGTFKQFDSVERRDIPFQFSNYFTTPNNFSFASLVEIKSGQFIKPNS